MTFVIIALLFFILLVLVPDLVDLIVEGCAILFIALIAVATFGTLVFGYWVVLS